MDSEEPLANPTKTYGRKFAIKCLSKANLEKEELDVQMAEVCFFLSGYGYRLNKILHR
jgi:hypothetical protein